MDLQKPIDYLQMFGELVRRRLELIRQRDQTDVEIVKVNQLLTAMFPLLPEDKQQNYKQTMENMEAESSGLQDTIRLVFSEHKGEWLTASNVRDYLIEMGFELRHYQANPLASIGTTLKRMVPTHLESRTTESGTLYRRRLTPGDRIAAGDKELGDYAQTVVKLPPAQKKRGSKAFYGG